MRLELERSRPRSAALAALLGVAALVVAVPAGAQEAAAEAVEAAAGVAPETAYILNTFLFLVCGFLVMFMAAGFAMLEAGLVRKKSAGVQCLKNVALFAIAGVMFWLCGYNLMYDGVDGGYLGSFTIWSADDSAAEAGDFSAGYSASSDWFFQMVFCATTASIVSGAVAERVKLPAFFLFTAVLTGVVYPITGSWQWGEGWLYQMGFSDFAGSTLVHSVGGWAALAGMIVIGARAGRFGKDGRAAPMLASSLPLATLGTFILWLGWFGFNGGSQLALGSGADAIAVANIFVNTNVAAATGVLAAFALCMAIYKKPDLTLVLNGAIGGLVAITAEPLAPSLPQAAVIGAVGGALIVLTVPLLDKLKLDDVVGAVPAHLVTGIFGTLIVPWSNADASYATQATGVLAIGVFAFVGSLVLWTVLKFTMGVRVDAEAEAVGVDQAELGMEAYPEFGVAGASR